MKLIPVNNLFAAIIMAIIRNDCRKFMTRDQSKITLWKQIDWYFGKYTKGKDNSKLVGYLFMKGWMPIGYGFVHRRKDSLDFRWYSLLF